MGVRKRGRGRRGERGGAGGENRGRGKGGNKEETRVFIAHTTHFGLSAVLIIDADICQFLYVASHVHNLISG